MNVQNSVVPALERALNIIEYIAAHNEPVTLKQITSELHIPSASAFRLIKNLVTRGYVSENTDGHMTYILGSKFMSIASSYERNSSLHLAAKPVMLSLAAQLGQTVQLGIWKNGCLIYIDQAFSSAPLSIIAPLYEPVQINTSASAKIMLSLLPDAECQNALTTCKFHRLTDNTITDKTAFMEEIKKIKYCGYGYDDEEFAVGIGCLAVPIYDGQKKCVGTLGITGSIQEYRNKKKFEYMLSILHDSASKIAQNLIQ